MRSLVVALAEKISAMETAKFFEQRAALVNAGDAQAAWDKVGAYAARRRRYMDSKVIPSIPKMKSITSSKLCAWPHSRRACNRS